MPHLEKDQENGTFDRTPPKAAVPADKKLWARDQAAHQITWLSQFTDALIEDVQKSLPEEDCAPVEENARSR